MSETLKIKGRSSKHIIKRNNRLFARFYWYNNIVGIKFSKCLELLEIEFDLTETTLCDLISSNTDILSSLEREKITEKQLNNLYPFMVWKYVYSH